MASGDRSISDILQDVIRNLQDIVRSEVRLATAEVREEITKAKSAGLLLSIGALSGMFGVFFLLLAIVYALSDVLPNWAAALIVALALAICAGIALSASRRRFKQVHPTPDKTIKSLKENVKWAKQQAK